MILPDTPPDLARRLLLDSKYGGDTSRVIEAILEGVVPADDSGDVSPPEPSPAAVATALPPAAKAARPSVIGRANVFDEEELDVGRLHQGKQSISRQPIALDTSMKAEILRRAAELSSSEDEDSDDEARLGMRNVDLDGTLSPVDGKPVRVGVAGGEEESEDDGEGGEHEAAATEVSCVYLRESCSNGRHRSRKMLKLPSNWRISEILNSSLEPPRFVGVKNASKCGNLQVRAFHYLLMTSTHSASYRVDGRADRRVENHVGAECAYYIPLGSMIQCCLLTISLAL
jgi:activating signal cointegrator complex subunit 2